MIKAILAAAAIGLLVSSCFGPSSSQILLNDYESAIAHFEEIPSDKNAKSMQAHGEKASLKNAIEETGVFGFLETDYLEQLIDLRLMAGAALIHHGFEQYHNRLDLLDLRFAIRQDGDRSYMSQVLGYEGNHPDILGDKAVFLYNDDRIHEAYDTLLMAAMTGYRRHGAMMASLLESQGCTDESLIWRSYSGMSERELFPIYSWAKPERLPPNPQTLTTVEIWEAKERLSAGIAPTLSEACVLNDDLRNHPIVGA